MKKITAVALTLLLSAPVFSQSESFQTLEDRFKGGPDVQRFHVSGFLCRMLLGVAGEWEFKKAIQDVKHIRFMTIPRSEFRVQQLTLAGLKELMKAEGFEELASLRDHGDDVSLYLRGPGNKKNTYFVLVEEEDEVVAIELKGYIDPAILSKQNTFSRK